jgi:polysaccharide export outer membrane protein
MHKRFQIPIFIITILILSSVPIRAQDYLIGSDDVLKITVYREEDMDREVRVSSDGYISFPLLNRVKAEGLTVQKLERNLIMELTRYLKNPQITVFIQEYGTITVSGQVEKPGSYPLKGEISVIEAISIAGGFTKIAAQNAVKVMRLEGDKKNTILVRVADISKKGDKSKDIPLKRGDIVFVPESLF